MTIVWSSRPLHLGQPSSTATPWYMGALVLVLAIAARAGRVRDRAGCVQAAARASTCSSPRSAAFRSCSQNTGQLKFVLGPYPKPIPSLFDSTELSMIEVSVRIGDIAR